MRFTYVKNGFSTLLKASAQQHKREQREISESNSKKSIDEQVL